MQSSVSLIYSQGLTVWINILLVWVFSSKDSEKPSISEFRHSILVHTWTHIRPIMNYSTIHLLSWLIYQLHLECIFPYFAINFQLKLKFISSYTLFSEISSEYSIYSSFSYSLLFANIIFLLCFTFLVLTLCSQFLAQGFIHNIYLTIALKLLPGMAYGKWNNIVWFWLTNLQNYIFLST